MTDTGTLALVTGATGYIGGRLVLALREAGVPVRAMSRRPDELEARLPDDVEVAGGDVLEPGSLPEALRGVDTAYYLVHSMGSGGDFRERDLEGARNFSGAAREAEVRRIVYLGGLGEGEDLSEHLESRQEVGRVLRSSGVETLELRASIIIGSGSLSFEMVRALVERLPVMICPRWVETSTQPIAVEDVLEYLVRARTVPLEGSEVVEIGAREAVTYGDLMREYARQRGLRRLMIPVPVLTPRLSGLWLGLVTPVYARVGRELIEGLRNRTVADLRRARELFDVEPRSVSEAIERALAREDREFAETRWSDARSSAKGGPRRDEDSGASVGPGGSRIVDRRSVGVEVSPEAAFRPIRRIGGEVGWYFAGWLWRVRGALDLLVGGPGMRRGRRDPENPSPGDTLDFWRVEAVEPGRLLRLRAEMKLPGRAWLEFEVRPRDGEGAEIHQTAIFDPAGLGGLLYWYALYPVHTLIFRGMLRRIAAEAEST
ncbi:MAG TPA: SDR family oxidoreductase [Longimicrobiales bacterium]|nr:SDR family oxidoreductase [Longimicrobiales bacterium]